MCAIFSLLASSNTPPCRFVCQVEFRSLSLWSKVLVLFAHTRTNLTKKKQLCDNRVGIVAVAVIPIVRPPDLPPSQPPFKVKLTFLRSQPFPPLQTNTSDTCVCLFFSQTSIVLRATTTKKQGVCLKIFSIDFCRSHAIWRTGRWRRRWISGTRRDPIGGTFCSHQRRLLSQFGRSLADARATPRRSLAVGSSVLSSRADRGVPPASDAPIFGDLRKHRQAPAARVYATLSGAHRRSSVRL